MSHFCLLPTSIGDCGIAWSGDVVVATHLPERTSAATAARLAARVGASEGQPPPEIQRAIASIVALLEGEKIDLSDITCELSGVESFARKVYEVARSIPAGETLTYGDIASQLGDKLLAQNVGRALGRNPLPIIVPCHRVVGANGKLTGFSAYGGLQTKRKMLWIEGARTGETLSLFDELPSSRAT